MNKGFMFGSIVIHESCDVCREERIFRVDLDDLPSMRLDPDECPKCRCMRRIGNVTNFRRWISEIPYIFGNTPINRMMLLSMIENKKEANDE